MRVLSCDDHELFREGLRGVVSELGGDGGAPEVIGVPDAESALRELAAQPFDLVLLDLALPGTDGFQTLSRIRSLHPGLKVVIVSASERPEHGEVLTQALRLVLAGGIYVPATLLGGRAPAALSPRQLEVLRLLERGLTNSEIADVLKISFGTAKNHVAAVIEGLDATNRTEAVMVARELGLLED
jgi:DNA-binding NarL/FixJ family response regulator